MEMFLTHSQCSKKYLRVFLANSLNSLILAFRTVKPGTLLIDSSTIDPATAKMVAVEAEKKGAIYMDAPVSGGNFSELFLLSNMLTPNINLRKLSELLDKMLQNVILLNWVTF